jgi:hypothetical protein
MHIFKETMRHAHRVEVCGPLIRSIALVGQIVLFIVIATRTTDPVYVIQFVQTKGVRGAKCSQFVFLGYIFRLPAGLPDIKINSYNFQPQWLMLGCYYHITIK